VTGGAGCIGSHAARALRRSGYEVVLYDNLSTGFRRLTQGFELVAGDIADEAWSGTASRTSVRPISGMSSSGTHQSLRSDAFASRLHPLFVPTQPYQSN